MDKVGIGIIGCGTISTAYLNAARVFPILKVRGVADIRAEAAEARAREFGLEARSVAQLLSDPEIEIIVNLTVPQAHAAVGHACDHSREARVFRKAACGRPRRGEEAPRRGRGTACSRRLCTRHLPRRRASDRPQAHRRWRDWPADRRDRLLHGAGTRALAPEPGLLLSQAAAGRCSTWGPTTSPRSSTSSAP